MMPNPLEDGNYNPGLVWINKINQSEFRVVLNPLKNGNYDPNLIWINRIPKIFLCVWDIAMQG